MAFRRFAFTQISNPRYEYFPSHMPHHPALSPPWQQQMLLSASTLRRYVALSLPSSDQPARGIGPRGNVLRQHSSPAAQVRDMIGRTHLGLRYEHIGVEEDASAQATPYPEDVGPHVTFTLVNHVWCDDSNDCLITFVSKMSLYLDVLFIEGRLRLCTFHNQFDAVESATPRERIGNGKISPMRTHPTPPQVLAKKKI